MLDPVQSRSRQRRLLQSLSDARLDAVVLGLPHHVYWATAHLPGWWHQAAFVLFADGRSWLCSANQPNLTAAADEAIAYEANWKGTQRQEQPAVVASHVVEALRARSVQRIGVDASPVTSQVILEWDNHCQAIDPILWQLRRRKDADELALMKTAVRCAEAMYERARQIIAPGVSELHVYAELHAAALAVAGEPLSALLGNDYATAAPGGMPRKGRTAQAGELYILDLGPAYRGYFSDSCRTFAVDRHPTDEQLHAWQAIAACFPIVETMARPGARCRDIYHAVESHLGTFTGYRFGHHLGHGVGLQPHEYPHLNPQWDDVLIEGEIFTAEPGLYAPSLRAGIRIENQYLVTSTGVENLLSTPKELVQ